MLNREDIIRMARETNASFETAESMFKFAQLVAKAEREACAKVCEDLAELNRVSPIDSMWEWGECAAAIRTRDTV